MAAAAAGGVGLATCACHVGRLPRWVVAVARRPSGAAACGCVAGGRCVGLVPWSAAEEKWHRGRRGAGPRGAAAGLRPRGAPASEECCGAGQGAFQGRAFEAVSAIKTASTKTSSQGTKEPSPTHILRNDTAPYGRMTAKPTCKRAGTPAAPSLPRAASLRSLRGLVGRRVCLAPAPRHCTCTGCPGRDGVPDGELGLLRAALPRRPVPPSTAMLPVPPPGTPRVEPKARPTEGHRQRQARARPARAARWVLPVCAARLQVRVHARAALGLLLAVLRRPSLAGALPGG